MTTTINPSDLGFIIDGVVEQDPMDDRFRIRTIQNERQVLIDPQELLKQYNGKEVKLTLASLENLQLLQEVLEESGGAVGDALMPQDVPGAQVKTTRKPD